MSNVTPLRSLPIDRIMAIQHELQSLPAADFPVSHFFAPGVYVRAMLIREGHCLTGAVHTTDHLSICAGDLTVLASESEEALRYTGFHILFSRKGVKRAGFAHSDTFFATIHPTEETDIAKLEAMLTEPDPVPAIEQEGAP